MENNIFMSENGSEYSILTSTWRHPRALLFLTGWAKDKSELSYSPLKWSKPQTPVSCECSSLSPASTRRARRRAARLGLLELLPHRPLQLGRLLPPRQGPALRLRRLLHLADGGGNGGERGTRWLVCPHSSWFPLVSLGYWLV